MNLGFPFRLAMCATMRRLPSAATRNEPDYFLFADQPLAIALRKIIRSLAVLSSKDLPVRASPCTGAHANHGGKHTSKVTLVREPT